MSWIMRYESPFLKKKKEYRCDDIDEFLKEVKILLLTGYTITYIDFGGK